MNEPTARSEAADAAAKAQAAAAETARALRDLVSAVEAQTAQAQADARTAIKAREDDAKRTRRRYNVMFVVAGVILVAVVVLGVGLRIFTDASDKRSAQNRNLLIQVAATNRTLANYTTGPAAQASAANEQRLIVCILDRIDKDTKGTPIPASCAAFGIK
jgi:hypothetical protein